MNPGKDPNRLYSPTFWLGVLIAGGAASIVSQAFTNTLVALLAAAAVGALFGLIARIYLRHRN
jgi:hypothetical protein